MLYLSKLESKLDESLSKETRESLTEWIGFKRNKPKTRTMKTAVEWMVKQLNINGTVIPMEIEYKAKEMEKERIIKTYEVGISRGINYDEDVYHKNNWRSGEKYYNETFKSE